MQLTLHEGFFLGVIKIELMERYDNHTTMLSLGTHSIHTRVNLWVALGLIVIKIRTTPEHKP